VWPVGGHEVRSDFGLRSSALIPLTEAALWCTGNRICEAHLMLALLRLNATSYIVILRLTLTYTQILTSLFVLVLLT
jgi:hypothetical protein